LHSAKHAKRDMSSPFEFSRPRNLQDMEQMTQEEKDHRLAVHLQEQDDAHVTRRRGATEDTSMRTSRSNAYSQVQRVSRDAILPYVDANSMVGFAWPNQTKEPPPSQQNEIKKPVLFKDGSIGSFSGGNILPLPRDQMEYAPIDLQEQGDNPNSVVPEHNRMQETSNPEDQNSSLLSQVANHILGSMGSWDVSTNVDDRRARTSLPSAHENKPDTMMMSTEGQEVQLQDDVRQDESTMMPPPEPRVQIDWPSRVGSCHSWIIPETIGAGAAYFGMSGGTHTRESTYGISTTNSLEMDGSTNTEHLSCTESVGGGSLCQVFKDGEEDAYMRIALREVPSWERSMRSKSPLSIGSVGDHDDDSSYRIPNGKPHNHQYMTPILDNETNEPEDMDMDWEEGHPE
jgi:hypothetical protein